MRNRGDAKQDAIRLAVIRRDHTMTDEAVVRTHSPIKTVWGWSAKLTRSIVLKDGTRLVTLAAVRRFILKQPEHMQDRGSWHQAAELVILAVEYGGSIGAATTQVEDALSSGSAVRASVAMMCVGGACLKWPLPPIVPLQLGAGRHRPRLKGGPLGPTFERAH